MQPSASLPTLAPVPGTVYQPSPSLAKLLSAAPVTRDGTVGNNFTKQKALRSSPSADTISQPPSSPGSSPPKKKSPPKGSPNKVTSLSPLHHGSRSKFDQMCRWVEKIDSEKPVRRSPVKSKKPVTPLDKTAVDDFFAQDVEPGKDQAAVDAYLVELKSRTTTPASASAKAPLPPIPKEASPKKKPNATTTMAMEVINSRYTDMFKAFQFVDLDHSGTLNEKEIRRAFDMWNIPVDGDKLQDLLAACDADGSGEIDYKEFVDVLARDTVAPAALGKRGMQAKEAMGVESLDKAFLGHGSAPKSALTMTDGETAPPAEAVDAAATGAPAAAAPASAAPKPAVDPSKSGMVTMVREKMNSQYTDMYKAFQFVDLDRSGTLNEKEIRRALDLWNIPVDEAKLAEIIGACDGDQSGEVDYKEFVDVLARDTVAPAALGKRGMQAEEAMGVASLDKAFLGHGSAPKSALLAKDLPPVE